MPSVVDLEALIGRTGRITLDTASGKRGGQLRVSVVVVDVKHAYGQIRYKVRPHDNRTDSGSAWVGAKRVALDPQEQQRRRA